VARLTGWCTPTVAERVRSPEAIAKLADTRLRTAGQKTVPLYLMEQAQLTGWTTPSATDGVRGGGTGITEGMTGTSLTQLAQFSGWPTPMADCNRGASPAEALRDRRPNGDKVQKRLQDVAAIVGPARLTAGGELRTGSSAETRGGGQLSPAHSLWLMLGPFATAWVSCGERVTPSRSGRRRPSLKRSSGA
jgi:hypothetical protein